MSYIKEGSRFKHLFWKGIIYLAAEFHKTEIVIWDHSREKKASFYT